MQDQNKYRLFMIFMTIALIIVAIASLFIGRYSLSFQETFRILANIGHLDHSDTNVTVLFNLRLPRIIATMMVGGALAVAGASFQAVLKNSLASPDVLGTSSAAGFGAALGILLISESFIYTSIFSFLFGILSIVIVFAICHTKKSNDELSIILSGIIVTSLFISFTSIIKFVADPEDTLPSITFWLMGSFATVIKLHVYYLIALFALCYFILHKLRWKMNILSLGDEEARLSGINPQLLRIVLLLTASILVSASVTLAGVIGWVGLVIPHLVRSVLGYNHGKLIPASALTGALFVLVMDNIARSITYAEIPIGILTSLIGAPLFAFLFIKSGKK